MLSAPRPILLLATCMLLMAPSLRAQDQGEAEPDHRQAVWSFLNAPDRASEKLAKKQLRLCSSLTLESLQKILNGPPPLPAPTRGRIDRIPFTIPGTRTQTTYELLVPESYDPGVKLPLWIGIHGTSGHGDSVIRGLSSLAGSGEPVLIAAPTEAESRHGKGWGYSHPERMLHVGLIDAVARRYAVDRDRVALMGWSRGGHGTFDVAARFPDRFSGAGPVIGSAPIRDLPLLRNMLGQRVMVINGGLDQPELVAAVKRCTQRLKSEGVKLQVILDPTRGHVGFHDRLPEMIKHLLPARRSVAPAHLKFSTWDIKYDRAFYVRVTKLSSKTYKPGRPIKARGATSMTQDQKLDFIARHVNSHTATVEVRASRNLFDVTTKLVKRFELYLPLKYIDFDKPVDIMVNGKLRKKNLKVRRPKPVEVLRLMKEFAGADPAFRFAARYAFPVR